jgi:hypothetical protein
VKELNGLARFRNPSIGRALIFCILQIQRSYVLYLDLYKRPATQERMIQHWFYLQRIFSSTRVVLHNDLLDFEHRIRGGWAGRPLLVTIPIRHIISKSHHKSPFSESRTHQEELTTSCSKANARPSQSAHSPSADT